jgi:hypothetical protein
MNIKNWSIEHTKGLIVGILTILVAIFIIIGIFSYTNNVSYNEMMHRFIHLRVYTAKIISLAAIANLPWFHFVSLKQANWAFGQGIIAATVIDLLVMLVVKFIL